MKQAITNRVVASLLPQEKPYEIRDTQLKGLLLRVQPSGIMTYYLEYKRGGRHKIGRADAITPFEARELAKKVLSEVYQGNDPADKRRSLKDATYLQFIDKDYKEWLLANLRTGKATYDSLKRNFTELHSLKLYEITVLHVEKWRTQQQKKGCKPSSINRGVSDLRACLSRALEWGIIEAHPLAKLKPLKVDTYGINRYLTQSEEKRLRLALDQRQNEQRADRKSANQWRQERKYLLLPDLAETLYTDLLKPAVLLSMNTGLRRGELFGLRWSNIDFTQRLLTVTAEIAKSGKARHIPLNDEALLVLQGMAEAKAKKGELLFPGPDGKPIHDMRSSWENILLKAKITAFRWHDLRHSFASKLVMAGVDLNTVRELMGHSDYKMTLRYAHLAPEHKAEAVARLCQKKRSEQIF